MTKISLDSVVVRKQVIFSRIHDDVMILDPQSGSYFAIRQVGADIWDLIETPRSLRDICLELIERYDVDEEACAPDVKSFVTELVESGLIVECN